MNCQTELTELTDTADGVQGAKVNPFACSSTEISSYTFYNWVQQQLKLGPASA